MCPTGRLPSWSAAAAPYLTLSGRRIDAAEALRIGLVAWVVPAAELMDAVGRVARDIAVRARR